MSETTRTCVICGNGVSLRGTGTVQIPGSKGWAHDICIKYLAHQLEAGELKRAVPVGALPGKAEQCDAGDNQ